MTIINFAGRLQYEKNRVVILLPKEFGDYYRSLIPPYRRKNTPKYPPHITVVRNFEFPISDEKFRDGELINFQYSNEIWFDGTYYFMEVYSKEIEEIRVRLGLPRFRSNKSCFHVTIGNVK